MDAEVRKKMLIPFIVLLGILAVNVNTIMNAVAANNPVKIVFACVSSLLVLGVFVIMLRNAKKVN